MFYTLYGHLSKNSLNVLSVGQKISRDDIIGYVGNNSENGNWVPHLHFQIMLSMVGNKNDFPGVAYKKEINIWKSICPDPNLLFNDPNLINPVFNGSTNIITERRTYLGHISNGEL